MKHSSRRTLSINIAPFLAQTYLDTTRPASLHIQDYPSIFAVPIFNSTHHNTPSSDLFIFRYTHHLIGTLPGETSNMVSGIPTQHRGLVLESVQKDMSGVHIKTLSTPQVEAGSAVVRVLAAGVLSYQRDIYDGTRDYPLPKPLVGGYSAIGRVVAVGSDAVSLQPGKLVHVDCVICGRDDLGAVILSANSDGFNENTAKLIRDVWRNGVFAEFAKFPLENCVPLDKERLCQSLGYSVQD